MTGFAGRCPVRACQEKCSHGVIKHLELPTAGDMACIAFDLQSLAVHIDVTTGAIRWCRTKRFSGFMTVRAGDFQVQSVQAEVGHCVIETVFVESRDLMVPTLVIGMAITAFRLTILCKTAVQAQTQCNVLAYVCVTVDTEIGLSHIRQRRMTKFAFSFQLCMTRCDFARHDQPLLEFAGGNWQRRTQQEDSGNNESYVTGISSAPHQ